MGFISNRCISCDDSYFSQQGFSASGVSQIFAYAPPSRTISQLQLYYVMAISMDRKIKINLPHAYHNFAHEILT